MPEPYRDRILLIAAALATSLAAWALWHYLDQHAFDVLILLALVCAMVDNWRLRRGLRRSPREDREP